MDDFIQLSTKCSLIVRALVSSTNADLTSRGMLLWKSTGRVLGRDKGFVGCGIVYAARNPLKLVYMYCIRIVLLSPLRQP